VVQRDCDGDRHRVLSSSNRGKEGGEGGGLGWYRRGGDQGRKMGRSGGEGKRTWLNRKVSDFITCFN
jgi:hypothetical protein